MGSDRADLIESYFKQLAAFRLRASAMQAQESAAMARDWSQLSGTLSESIFPRLGPAVQLAARSMMGLIASALNSAGLTDQLQGGNQNIAATFRSVWSGIATAQISELEKLLRDAPNVPQAGDLTTEDVHEPNRATAKTLLEEAVNDAGRRDRAIRAAGFLALGVGSGAVVAAAVLPFVFHPPDDAVGWVFVAGWGVRVVAIGTLVVAAVHLFNVFRDLMGRAATAGRDTSLLKVLAASAYLGNGKDQAAAFVELVRSLSQQAAIDANKEQGLVLPASLLKELPDIIKIFKSGK